MKGTKIGYMVFWDNGDGYRVSYGEDPNCEGALQADDNAPLLFETRPEARKAIEISVRYARLCQSQGRPWNDDFTEGHKNVKVVPVYMASCR